MRKRTVLLAEALLLFGWQNFAAAAERQTLDDSELSGIRAGYADPNGLNVSLGAVMKSYVDGRLVLESTMNIDAGTINVSQQIGAGAQPLSTTASSPLPMGAAGAVLAGPGGATTFLHGFSDRGLSNMVINTANGRDIMQSMAITVAIPNLQQLQQQAALAGFATQLHDMLGSSLLNAAPR